MNRRKAMLATGAGLVTAAGGGLWFADARGTHGVAPAIVFPSAAPTSEQPSPEPPAQVLAKPVPVVNIETKAWFSWALMDRSSGEIASSGNGQELSYTASMMKAWMAADVLRRASESGKKPTSARLAGLSTMIRDSDNEQGSATFRELGRSATVTRMNSICGLTGAQAGDGYARTKMSAQDACRLAHAIGCGVAAGPEWTPWLLDEMRQVRGYGDFGIRKAFPAQARPAIAIKNGWEEWDNTNQWTVNCLAVTELWAMSVLTAYPRNLGLDDGMRLTEQVAAQLMTSAHLV